MNRRQRSRQSRWNRAAHLLLAVLAFAGAQAAFMRAAFPRRYPSTGLVVQQGGPVLPMPSVDVAHVPQRVNRRAAVSPGPGVPSLARSMAVATIARDARPPAPRSAPSGFVPPPPFHPPRAQRA